MDQRKDEFNQKLIAYLTIGGGVLFVVGLVSRIFFIMILPLMALSWLMLICGMGLAVSGIAYGLMYERTQHEGHPVVEPHCRVMARYGVNELNEIVTSDWAHDDVPFRPFVRLHSPRRGAMEFECALPVWEQCGEGMDGEAIIQGRWLSSFTPYMGLVAGPQP